MYLHWLVSDLSDLCNTTNIYMLTEFSFILPNLYFICIGWKDNSGLKIGGQGFPLYPHLNQVAFPNKLAIINIIVS